MSDADDGSGSDLDSSPDFIADAWFSSETVLTRQVERWQRTRLLDTAPSGETGGTGKGKELESIQGTDTADISEWSSSPALPGMSPPQAASPSSARPGNFHAELEDGPILESIQVPPEQRSSSSGLRDAVQESQRMQGFIQESQGMQDFVQESLSSAYSGITSTPVSSAKSVTSSPAHRARLRELSRQAEFFQARDAPLFCIPNTPSSDEIHSRTTTTTGSDSKVQSTRNQPERTLPRSMSVDAPLLDTPSKRPRSFGSELGRTMNVTTSELPETLRSVTDTEGTDSDLDEADAHRTTSVIDPTSTQKLHPWNWSQVQDVTETSIRLTTGASRSSSLKQPAAPGASVTASDNTNSKKLRFAPISEQAKAPKAGPAAPRTLALGAALTTAKTKPAAVASAKATIDSSGPKRVQFETVPQSKAAQAPLPAQPQAQRAASPPVADWEEPVLPKTFRGFKSVGDHVREIEKRTQEKRKKRLAKKTGSDASTSFGSSSSSSTAQRSVAAPHLFRGMHFLLLVAYDRSTFQWINRIYENGGTIATSSASLFSRGNDAKRVTQILTKYTYADCCKELRVASLEALPVRTVKFEWLSECVERKQITLENGLPPASFLIR